jgi:phosphoribosylaminoimidazole-succinocarboxamide synthase
MSANVLLQTEIADLPVRRGKVRDIYDLGDQLLIVATDRISAFDVVMPNGIPQKGVILTQMSRFWFDWLDGRVKHHLLDVVDSRAPAGLDSYLPQLRGRAMLCKKVDVVPIECVVRGYLAGSGWKDYQQTGAVCGIELPAGMQQCQQLPESVFTPATKAETGHDENISFDRACEVVGRDVMEYIRRSSIDIYRSAAEYARPRGIIIADTKFEWGKLGDEYILIDEVLTPDSSRFWPADQYRAGQDQPSFDKQYVRNWLQEICDRGQWDKTPPAPELAPEVVTNTAAKYAEAYQRLTGKELQLQ